MPYPKKIETVHVEKLDNELCIYDWQRMEVHNLNPTAAKVWELCDGQTSPAQIAEQLQTELNTPHAEELVWLTLARLEKAHLLAEREAVVKPSGYRTLTRRELLVGLGVAAALLPVISSIVAPGPVEAQSPVPPTATATPTGTLTPTTTPIAGCSAPLGQSQTFSFTPPGAEQQFVVPTGVTCVTIQAFGAEGGGSGSAGGEGGTIQATIPVTPGETLFVYVGGQGEGRNGSGTGGFNGGGTGGANGIEGAGGGGASDVRQGGNGLNNRVVVAGGGGGQGISFTGYDGGYLQGQGNIQVGDGGGGTQTSGGNGGPGQDGAADGTAGTFGIGGNGGAAGGAPFPGGGGGGGYYGGGGGGGDNDGSSPDGGGGGGGSGFVIPTATNVSSTNGGRTGNGQVIISW
jgi:hypothetical protein